MLQIIIKPMLSGRKQVFWYLQAEISSAMVAVFDLERSWDRPFRGNPQIKGNGQKWPKNRCFFAENRFFGLPRPRPIQPRSRFSIWGNSGDRHFWGSQPPNFNQNPYLYSGLSQRGAACHAFLWTDQIPELRIYGVIAV